MTTRLVLRTSVICVVTAVVCAATPAAAAPDAAGQQQDLTSGQVSAATQRETLRYWTHQRMADATPVSSERDEITRVGDAMWELLEFLRGEMPQQTIPPVESPAADPPQLRVAPQAPGAPATPVAAGPGSRWPNGGGVIASVGLVYFSDGVDDMSCSAAVVNSENRDTVVTAGHCVNDGAGNFYSNWTFVPSYSNGRAPYGQWAARQLFTTTGWSERTDINEDVGFAVLGSSGGQHIADVVGAQRISFGTPTGVDVYSFGYPGTGGYDGESLYYCAGRTGPDEIDADSTDIGLDCGMEEGSSGGPWLANFDGNTGTVVSVNSFGYEEDPGVMLGPRLDSSIKRVYDVAGVI